MNRFGKFAAIALIGISATLIASAQAADAPKPDAKAGDMMGNMKMMEDQMAAIMNEKDPAKRKELMEKHMDEMHQHMQMMMGMMKGSSDKDMTSRMKMMEERMDKMEKEMHGMGMMGKSTAAPAKAQDAKPAEHDHQH
jgi:hypothetical protein